MFFSWVNTALPPEDTITPKMHYILVDELLSGYQNVEALVFRGGAKSTITTKQLPLFVADTGELPNFGRCVNIGIFSATYSQAVDLMKDLVSAWDTSDHLQSSLKLARNNRGKIIGDRENYICFENDKGQWTHISAYGEHDCRV